MGHNQALRVGQFSMQILGQFWMQINRTIPILVVGMQDIQEVHIIQLVVMVQLTGIVETC